jgi:hypothetical protein
MRARSARASAPERYPPPFAGVVRIWLTLGEETVRSYFDPAVDGSCQVFPDNCVRGGLCLRTDCQACPKKNADTGKFSMLSRERTRIRTRALHSAKPG